MLQNWARLGAGPWAIPRTQRRQRFLCSDRASAGHCSRAGCRKDCPAAVYPAPLLTVVSFVETGLTARAVALRVRRKAAVAHPEVGADSADLLQVAQGWQRAPAVAVVMVAVRAWRLMGPARIKQTRVLPWRAAQFATLSDTLRMSDTLQFVDLVAWRQCVKFGRASSETQQASIPTIDKLKCVGHYVGH